MASRFPAWAMWDLEDGAGVGGAADRCLWDVRELRFDVSQPEVYRKHLDVSSVS